MKKSKLVLILTLLVTAAMISCKDSKKKKESGDSFPEFIQGVWQYQGADNGDEIGIFVTADSLGGWDYAGDEFDQDGDCYYYVFATAAIVSYIGNEYRLKYFDSFEETVTIDLDGNLLTIGYDPEGEPESDTYSKDSRTVASMTPICTDSFFKSRPDVEQKRQKLLDALSGN